MVVSAFYETKRTAEGLVSFVNGKLMFSESRTQGDAVFIFTLVIKTSSVFIQFY